jgi:hypothetical protein
MYTSLPDLTARLEDLEWLLNFIRQNNIPADIAALQAQLNALTLVVAGNTSSIVELETDVTDLEAQVANIFVSLTVQGNAIVSNTASISALTGSVAINTADIALLNQFFAAPGSIITTNFSMPTNSYWKLFAAGSYTITAPVSPTVGAPYDLTQTSGDLTSTPVAFVAGGAYLITDPQNTLAAPASSVAFKTNGLTYRFRFDGSVFRCVN